MDINFFALDTATIVALVVSVIIPLCSAALARPHWPSEVVGILTLFLATANGFLSQWLDAGSDFRWQGALSTAVLSFVLAIAARYGLWKGTVTDARALAFGSGLQALPVDPSGPLMSIDPEPVIPTPAFPAGPVHPQN